MVDRVKSAVDARTDSSFVIMARTDAAAVEGIDAAIERAVAYVEAGADMIFPEAMTSLEDYRRFRAAVIPIGVLGVVGTFATAALIAVAAHVLFDFGWATSGIVGAALATSAGIAGWFALDWRRPGIRAGSAAARFRDSLARGDGVHRLQLRKTS
mgnify:CR=1 FL=1